MTRTNNFLLSFYTDIFGKSGFSLVPADYYRNYYLFQELKRCEMFVLSVVSLFNVTIVF